MAGRLKVDLATGPNEREGDARFAFSRQICYPEHITNEDTLDAREFRLNFVKSD